SAGAADRRCFYYFLTAVIVIRYETTATTRWTSLLIVRAFFNDTVTVAVWTDFHVRLMRTLSHPSDGRLAMGGMMQMAALLAFSALAPKADMCSANRNVRFGPIADICDVHCLELFFTSRIICRQGIAVEFSSMWRQKPNIDDWPSYWVVTKAAMTRAAAL